MGIRRKNLRKSKIFLKAFWQSPKGLEVADPRRSRDGFPNVRKFYNFFSQKYNNAFKGIFRPNSVLKHLKAFKE